MSDKQKFETMSGPAVIGAMQRVAVLANDLQMQPGWDARTVSCLLVTVAADIARGLYGNDALPDLAGVLLKRGEARMPHHVVSFTHDGPVGRS